MICLQYILYLIGEPLLLENLPDTMIAPLHNFRLESTAVENTHIEKAHNLDQSRQTHSFLRRLDKGKTIEEA